ncbi:DUF6095 family protein [Winogradskyella alexanderae]|uniref:DUF6095 family protein n=1 Tax=Winogradskyella alexanderae TaxID=2877123 RepID=A0ABS7XSP4_9FLAO|nr:DUF6095 family protein [Winogradskyella alexanderae]MCA0133038.1 DUF6095 family protein [Winogradskyella alexanderae]
MEENNRTDKEVLIKGVKRLLLCLLLMFAGPILLHISFSNDDKPLYIPLLVLSLVICVTAIILLFVGINTIIKSMFK